MSRLEVGQVLELGIDRLAFGGDGVARHEGQVVFVPFAAPGDRIRARVRSLEKNFARASIEAVLTPSPLRRAPPCPHFGICGGCQLQHLTEAGQRQAKTEFVRDALRRIGGIDWQEPIRMIAGDGFGYRLRARLCTRGDKVGYYRADSHEVIDVETCPILVPELNHALAAVREQRGKLPRELTLAAGDTGVATAPALAGMPQVPLRRRVGGHEYALAPDAFFQANAQVLEAFVAAAMPATGGGLALDLFAGVGLFTLPLAQRFEQVTAVESDPVALQFLRANVPAHVHIEPQPVDVWLARPRAALPPDFALLDPPRTGARGALERLAALGVPRIVYVACDPATCARDLKPLVAKGWSVRSVVAVDLFPQTFHVETIVHLASPGSGP